MLSRAQIEEFEANGVLVVEDAVDAGLLARLRADFAAWVAESAGHDAPYGECIDGRPRFDIEPGDGERASSLRRVQAPTDVSEAYREAMADSAMTDMVADLIGPDVKLHHTKINSKLPGTGTQVRWHQDFPFTPHSNADVITALLMVDDVTAENGPLAVCNGSHKGPIHGLWHDGVFTGAMAPEIEATMQRDARLCLGKAGSVCLMHTRLAHGSEPNLSAQPRTLFISVYSAGDAVPLTPSPVPTKDGGLFVRGSDPHRVRGESFETEVPQYPKTSFFAQQSETEREA